jgi:hypothetical protein
MNSQDYWEKALKHTEIVRPRVQPLSVTASTQLPYIFLAESAVNAGDTVVRKGEVEVEKPALLLPSDLPQLQGFEPENQSEWDTEGMVNFLFVRGVRFPSFKYNNKVRHLDLYEGKLKQAVDYYLKQLQEKENLNTGLVIGPEECWQFSVLIFIGMQASRQAEGDVRRLWDDFWKRLQRPEK